jgi:hypothetical protein
LTEPTAGFAPRPSLRFAVMEADLLAAWQVKVIEHLIAQKDADLVLFIKAPPTPHDVPVRTIIRHMLKPKLLWRLFYSVLSRSSRAMRLVNTTATFPSVRALVCDTQIHGVSEYFSQSDVVAIERENLDFILQFRSGIVSGHILNAARYGVWSFHHGDEQQYRGGPPGFWEIYSGAPVNGAILQRFTEQTQAGIILKKGYFKTIGDSYTRHIDQLYFDTVEWPAYVAAEIRNGAADYLTASPSQSDAPSYEAPSNPTMLRFFMVIARNKLRFVNELLHKDEWNVGMVHVPPSYFLNGGPLPPTDWMQVAPKNWVADPMAVVVDGTVHVLCEQWNDALNRGTISRTTFDEAGWGKLECAIASDVHASYPYLFEDDRAIYCVPETVAANETALYRAAPFPALWVKECVLLTGSCGVDSTVFRHEGLWWLLCTRSGGFTYTTSNTQDRLLYAYFADNLLGPWHPHLANPVKMDIRSSRPAGPPFVHDGKLFRPAQDCSKTYGGRVVINRIEALSPSAFREETYAVVEPDCNGPYPSGLHTLTRAGNMCVIDGKRLVLRDMSEIVSRLLRALRRSLTRPRAPG